MKIKALLLSLAIIANTMPSANTNTEEKRCYFTIEKDNSKVILDTLASLHEKIQTECDRPFRATIKNKSEIDRLEKCLVKLNIAKDYSVISKIKKGNEGTEMMEVTVNRSMENPSLKSHIQFYYPIKFDEIITQRISPCLEQYKNKNLKNKLDTDKLDNEFVTCISNSLKGTNFILKRKKEFNDIKSVVKFLIEEVSFNPEEEHIQL